MNKKSMATPRPFLLLLLILIWFIPACSPREVVEEDTRPLSLLSLESESLDEFYFDVKPLPQLTVKLQNATADEIGSLGVSFTLVTLTGQMPLPAKPDAKGEIQLSLKHSLPYQQIWFSIGDVYYGQLLVQTDLAVSVDIAQLKKQPAQFWGQGIAFTGTDGKVTEFFNRHVAHRRQERLSVDSRKQTEVLFNRQISLEQRLAKLKELRTKLDEIDEDFFEKYPSEFKHLLRNESRSLYWSEVFMCHFMARLPIDEKLLGESLQHKPLLVTNDSWSYYRHLAMAISTLSETEELQVLEESVGPIVKDKEGFATYLNARRRLPRGEKVDRQILIDGKKFLKMAGPQQKSRRQTLRFEKIGKIKGRKGDLVKIANSPEDLWEREAYLQEIRPTLLSRWAQAFLKAQWDADLAKRQEVTKKLNSSLPLAEDATFGKNILNLPGGVRLYASNHKSAEELVQSIRAKFPAKGLILDFWGPWCAPCLTDMKDSKEIKQKLKSLPLEIIYLCVSSDRETWSQKVAELNVAGTHIFLNEKLSNELLQFFDVRGFPTYLFIGANGEYRRDLIQRLSSADIEKIKTTLRETK